jgi:hypothetical protein
MRAAVKFHGRTNLKAVEIDDILSDRKLATKLESRATVS